MPITTWTKEDLLNLYKLRIKEEKSWLQISEIIGRSPNSIERKCGRMDWDNFIKDPSGFYKTVPRKWLRAEMIQLDAYLQSGKSYDFIAEKLGRSITSVERQAQTTDWKAWKSIPDLEGTESEVEDENFIKDKLIDQLVNALLTIIRYDLNRLKNVDEKQFTGKVNMDKSRFPIPFAELKQRAEDELERLGYKNPEQVNFGAGRYIIVGDSHGKHTKKNMFKMMEKVNNYLKPDKIIHIGHILDDDNDISYDWGRFTNLLILAKAEELREIQEQRNKFKFNYGIVRENINLGDLVILNQDIISDYVKTSIGSLDSEIFDDRVIVNCHRLEFFTRCSHNSPSYLASPGCLCEDHIVKTIKQIDFTDGRIVKQAFHEGFIKYRKMNHMCKYWERGMLVIEVDKDGKYTIVPCSIDKTSDGFTTSYFDKMITSKGVHNPDDKIFINGDIHSPYVDFNVLDIQEQICKQYKPTKQVNVGDTFNYSSLNHHLMDRGIPILNVKILDESAQTYSILERISKWTEDSYLIYGNHERFANDFVAKFPQFGEYLDLKFICSLDSLGYKLTKLKNILKIGSSKFVHGEIRMYGQPGNILERASRTFGKNVFIGHIHRPAIRFGCYSVGLTGKLDQYYNEPEASNWIHGFGMCNQFRGKSWPTTIAIIDNQCILNGKTYKPVNPDSWSLSSYKAKIIYDVESKK